MTCARLSALSVLALTMVWPIPVLSQSANECEPVSVDLTASAGTGYQWSLEPDENRVEIISRKLSLPTGALCGQAVTKYEVQPVEHGDYEIEFVLTRPWEKSVDPAEVKKVAISCNP